MFQAQRENCLTQLVGPHENRVERRLRENESDLPRSIAADDIARTYVRVDQLRNSVQSKIACFQVKLAVKALEAFDSYLAPDSRCSASFMILITLSVMSNPRSTHTASWNTMS